MEINITKLVDLGDFAHFSASRAELGDNAAAETWSNAIDQAKARRILKPAEREAFRDYARDFGAWDDDEISAWSAYECDALLIQMVAGDMQEAESLCPGEGPGGIDWTAYETLSQEGTVSGRVYASGAKVYFYVGS